MALYLIPFLCFVASYLLGVVIGRASVKIDRERENNGRIQRTE